MAVGKSFPWFRGWVLCGLMGVSAGSVFTSHAARAADLLYVLQPNNVAFDQALIEHFEQRHTVIQIDSADPELAEAAAQADVVYIAESIGSGTIDPNADGTVFREISTPVILAEAFAWDNAFFSGQLIHEEFGNTGRPEVSVADEAFLDLLDSIYVQNDAHPLAAGFSGKVQVFDEPFSLNFARIDAMGPGVDVIATADEAGQFATTFVYEPGAVMADGSFAAGRRIGIYLGQGSSLPSPPGPLLVFEYISPDGLKMLDAAIDYALNTGLPGDFDGNGSLDAADIDALSAAVRNGSTDNKFDLDGNGTVGEGDRVMWVEQLKQTYFGDSNLDGEFSSADFVQVFTQGEYEDALPRNSTWADGDWNGDQEFNSSDFVTAFTGGGFEIGPRAAVAAVPEPSSAVVIVGAGLTVMGYTLRGRRFTRCTTACVHCG